MKVLAALTLAVACVAAAPWWQRLSGDESEDSKPDFCKSYECPSYEVIESFDGYELREYDASVWVTTAMSGMSEDFWEDRSANSVFMKLFGYIQGSNADSQKMDMTVPVVNTHTKTQVGMSFYIPNEFSASPPVPTDTDVSITNAPKAQYYVRSFGGFGYTPFIGTNNYKTHLEELMSKIEGAGQSIDETMFITTGYNSPWELFNRHNEVWVPKN